MRKARFYGLIDYVEESEKGTKNLKYVKFFCGAALLPPDRICLAIEQVANEWLSDENVDDGVVYFIDYFTSHWLGNVKPNNFSVNGREKRTNNDQESYHGKVLPKLLGYKSEMNKFVGKYPSKNIFATDV